MVVAAIADGLAALAPLVAQSQDGPRFQIERLDPSTRAKVLAALTGLVILMLGVEVFRPLRELRVLLHAGMLGAAAARGIRDLLEA